VSVSPSRVVLPLVMATVARVGASAGSGDDSHAVAEGDQPRVAHLRIRVGMERARVVAEQRERGRRAQAELPSSPVVGSPMLQTLSTIGRRSPRPIDRRDVDRRALPASVERLSIAACVR